MDEIMGYKLTGRDELAEWFKRIHDWTWVRFPDPEYGEWFAYLDRYGEPTHMLKGGKWKCFWYARLFLTTHTLKASKQ